MTSNQENEIEQYLRLAGIGESGVAALRNMGYFECPASMRHHLACSGGLAIHSANVTRRLCGMTDALGIHWGRSESPYIIGMLHDLVKLENYRLSVAENGFRYEQMMFPGHGAVSVWKIQHDLRNVIELDMRETIAILWHMGTYACKTDADRAAYDEAMRLYPLEIIATHTADMVASHYDEVAM